MVAKVLSELWVWLYLQLLGIGHKNRGYFAHKRQQNQRSEDQFTRIWAKVDGYQAIMPRIYPKYG